MTGFREAALEQAKTARVERQKALERVDQLEREKQTLEHENRQLKQTLSCVSAARRLARLRFDHAPRARPKL